MKHFNIAICDDEPIWIERFRDVLDGYRREFKKDIRLTEYSSGM